MSTRTINISLDEELVKKIDKAAKGEYASRSDYIRSALVERLSSKKSTRNTNFQKDFDVFMKLYGEDLKKLATR